ncbi:hypothetical protein [Brevundimonas sp. TWP2-3-2]|uniref:hypothetical protein n=1 Tax=unclassified Brevundimonas TaxID=2622653 RepID=UPI003CF25AFC
MSRVLAIGLAFIALAACRPAQPAGPAAPAEAAPAVEAAAPAPPADPVAAFVERAELCVHFGGEEPYDAARAAEIAAAVQANRCEALAADGAALKASMPAAAAQIDAALAPLG